ncbi:discoidin domain-containing protein [uncultured Clostridium sp.]|uniref:discoidin domain-containing protein n=1 Tax=uncultured Clostridium sp. TaxID=59620 RepID=UPI002585CD6D|nr:discoidin domain-containing protein [uncultured Clostridium sp.]
MNKKKIMSVICIAAVTSYSIAPSLSSYATTLNNKPVQVEASKTVNAEASKTINTKENVSKAISLNDSNITLYGNWGGIYKVLTLGFDTNEMKFTSTTSSNPIYFCGATWADVYTVTLYNNDGTVESTKIFKGANTNNQFNSYIKGLTFKYGDYLKIQSNGLFMSLNGQEKSKDTIYVQINKDGLKKVTNETKNLKAVYGTKGTVVTGNTEANKKVYIVADGKSYNTISNSNGEFSYNLPINIKCGSDIGVQPEGAMEETIKSVINTNEYKLATSKLNIYNWWGTLSGIVSFNPLTKEMSVSGYNPYLGHTGTQCMKISLYNLKNSSIIKSEVIKGNDTTKTLDAMLNNQSFNYGDVIGISFDKSQTRVDVLNNNNNIGNTTGNEEYFKITQDGLEKINGDITVNPLNILTSNKITETNVTGKANPNAKLKVTVNNKEFFGQADANGNYNIKINDSEGFNINTKIIVSEENHIPVEITPGVSTGLQISKSSIIFKNANKRNAVKLTFNPINMKINANAENSIFGTSTLNYFNIKLIGNKDGQALKDINVQEGKTDNFVKEINNTSFDYGDIIAISVNQEVGLSIGEPSVQNANGALKTNCVGNTEYFQITKSGLEEIQNKDLKVNPILYTGQSTTQVSGKTIPNTKVNIWFNNKNQIVQSNENGDFTTTIPTSDITVGSVIRVYVNKDNAMPVKVQYDTNIYNIVKNRIEVVNDTNIPMCNITFDPLQKTISATKEPLDKTYTGTFYGNDLDIKIINPNNGDVIYNFTSNKIDDLDGFINSINGKTFNMGDIVQISYTQGLIKANVFNDNKQIGNTTGQREDFVITNKGLESVQDKFINVNGLDILGGEKVTSTSLTGKVSPNEDVNITVDKKVFSGKADANGNFNIKIECSNGFNQDTKIIVSAKGYINTIVKPKLEKDISLQKSSINLYNNDGWYGKIQSNIIFNPYTMRMEVNNYTNSFGNGQEKYLNIELYNSNGEELLSSEINNGSTSILQEALGGKSFNYGDIIGISYNNKISKPVILNGTQAIGNISGEWEYFQITKDGLVKVNFGKQANTTNVYWDNGNLVVNSVLAKGQSKDILDGKKKIIVKDSSGKVVYSKETQSLKENGQNELQGIINSDFLNGIKEGECYTISLEINGQEFNIKVSSNTESNGDYVVSANNQNNLSLVKENIRANGVNLTNSNEISSYVNGLNKNLNVKNINSNNINDLIKGNVQSSLLQKELIDRVGVKNLQDFFNKSEANKEFINWLLNNNTALTEYLNGPSPDGTNLEPGQKRGTDLDALQVWSNIWNTYTNSRSGFNLKLAIAVALSNATPIPAWPCSGSVGSPVERYNIFEKLNSEGGMLPIFKTLDVSHLTYIVDTRLPNSQIATARAIIMQNHNAFINIKDINDIAYTIHYNITYDGKSVFQSGFYGKNPTILNVWRNGGVCGSTSELGSIACQVFGLPARLVGQPGHAAFIYYNDNKVWTIGNNIFGWSKSTGPDMSGWSKGIATSGDVVNYDLLYEKADDSNLRKSNEYLWMANSQSSNENKMILIDKAIEIQPLNVRAWLDKINLLKSEKDTNVEDYINVSNGIINSLKDYPMPMTDLLLQIKNEILNYGSQNQYNNFIDNIKNALSINESPDQKETAKNLLSSLEGFGLIKNVISQKNMSIAGYSTEQNNTTYSINNILDGNPDTTWQNIWNGSDKHPYVEIKLDKEYSLQQILYLPRQTGNTNGNIQEYKLYTSLDGKNFTEASSGTFDYKNGDRSVQTINLDNVKCRYVKLEIVKGVRGLATIAEINMVGTAVNPTVEPKKEVIKTQSPKVDSTKVNIENNIEKNKAISKSENKTIENTSKDSKATENTQNGTKTESKITDSTPKDIKPEVKSADNTKKEIKQTENNQKESNKSNKIENNNTSSNSTRSSFLNWIISKINKIKNFFSSLF